MSRIPAELLINVGSRRSKGAFEEVMAALERHDFDVTRVNKVRPGDDLGKVLAAIKRRQPKLLIAGGGDGTISDLADHMAGSNIELGVIPLGTTNNFAKSLGIPADIDGAVSAIRTESWQPVDLGTINDDRFTNVTGIGLSALVARNVTTRSKRRWGRLAYAIVGLRQLIGHKPFMVTIQDIDHELKLHLETHQLIVANGRYHAGRQIAQDAQLDNRQLLIFALGSGSKLSFVWHMLDFYIGKRKEVAHASYLIARNVELNTSSPQPVEMDGEVKFETPVVATVQAAALKIRYRPPWHQS